MKSFNLKILKILTYPRRLCRLGSFLLKCFVLFSVITNSEAATLVLGSISATPNSEIKKLLPFVNYLVHNLQSEGLDDGKIRIEKNITRITRLLHEKKIDLYLGDPFTSLALNQKAGTHFLLQAISQGSAKHNSVIFIRSDPSIKQLKDLRGKIIAFDQALSTFGYLLPKWLLIEKGIKLKFLKTIKDRVASDEVGYIFSKDDLNTLLWVKKGKVVAGAVDYETYKKQPKDSLDQLKVIEKTVSLPPFILSYRSDLAPAFVKNIKDVLSKMDKTNEGKTILSDLYEISKFQDVSQKALAPLLKAYDYLNQEFK